MLQTKGKLDNGRTGIIDIIDNNLVIKVEKGFFRKRYEQVLSIPLVDIYSTLVNEKQSRFKKLNKLKIEYKKCNEQFDTSFFSNDINVLKAIKTAIDEKISIRGREWKSHIHQITLVIDIIDRVYQILMSLFVDKNYESMLESVNETEKIIREMTLLGVIAPVTMDTRGLNVAIRSQNEKQIKDEVYAILSIAHRDSERLAQYLGNQSFNLGLYEVFIKSYTHLWDLYLEKVIGIQMKKESFEELREIYSIVTPIQGNNSIVELLKEIKEFDKGNPTAKDFDKLQLLIRKSLTNIEF
jgi:hypothetical protein